MPSLFDVGQSAINAYRQSLAVTGQNIANINTDGYKRREADLKEVAGSQGGITTIANQSGLGVRVDDIRRSFDEFLSSRNRNSTSTFHRFDTFSSELIKIEDTLLPGENGLSGRLSDFFNSLYEISADPTSISARIIVIENGKALAEAFNSLSLQFENVQKGIISQYNDASNQMNVLLKELASVNSRIQASGQSGSSPNSTFDLRDKIIDEISKIANITVDYTGRGIANLSVGSSGMGTNLVNGTINKKVGFTQGFGSIQPIVISGSTSTATNQFTDGIINGLTQSFQFISQT